MKLYLVRLIENQEAVGIFWSSGGNDLWWEVDEVTAPGDCEWVVVKGNAAVIWPARGADRMGVDPDDEVGGFSMDGAEASESLGAYVDSWRPLKWTAFDPAPPEYREVLKAKASA